MCGKLGTYYTRGVGLESQTIDLFQTKRFTMVEPLPGCKLFVGNIRERVQVRILQKYHHHLPSPEAPAEG